MTDIADMGAVFIAGSALGFLYFRGLWYTVSRLPDAKSPSASLFCSFAARASLALGVFYLAMDGRWERLVAALLGFVLVREILVRRTDIPGKWTPRGAMYGSRSH